MMHSERGPDTLYFRRTTGRDCNVLNITPHDRPISLTHALCIPVSYTHLTLSSPSSLYNQSLEIEIGLELILLLCQVLRPKLRRTSH